MKHVLRGLSALALLMLSASTAPAEDGTPARAPAQNLIQVSWGDQIVGAHGDAELNTPEKIRRCMDQWNRDYNGKTILWRGASYYLERYYEMRGSDEDAGGYRGKVKRIMARFDPIAIAREQAKINGQNILIYMTIFDHGAPSNVYYSPTTPFPWQDHFTIDHPEFQTVDRRGNYHWGVLEMAYPECRKLMVDRIKTFISDYKTDGVYVCTRTHSLPALHADQFGFSPPIVNEMRKRFGVDITQDPRFDYQSKDFDSNNDLVEAWRKLRGEYVVQFYRELRQAIPKDKTIYTGLPRGRYLGPPYGNLYLDWESLIKEKLVDGIVLHVTSTKALHTPLYVPHRQIGYLSSEDDDINVPSIEQCVNEVYGPLAHANGVKLFYNTIFFGPRQQDELNQLHGLDGIMLWTPSTPVGRGRIASDAGLDFPDGQMTLDMRLFLNPRPSGFQRIVSKYDQQDDATRCWECLVLDDGKFQFKVNLVDPTTGTGSDVTVETHDPLPIQKWLHVAAVFDRPNEQMRILVDGKVSGQTPIPDRPMRMNAKQDIYIGRNAAWQWHYFDGKLDELQLLKKAVAEGDDIPDKPSEAQPETVALYHFDDITSDSKILNAAARDRYALQLSNASADVLCAGAPGFGRALDLSLDRDHPTGQVDHLNQESR